MGDLRPFDPFLKSSGIMVAVSADVDSAGKTYVALYWAPNPRITGYNLYRSLPGGKPPARPINGVKPIRAAGTCAELQAIVPPGSPEWDLMENALTGIAARAHVQFVADPQHRAVLADRTVLTGLKGVSVVETPAGRIPRRQPWRVDPCAALERGLNPDETRILDVLAESNLKIRLARGLAYIDSSVTAGARYVYYLRGVLADGTEVDLGNGVEVWAGHFRLPDPPSGFTATESDRKVLLLWNHNPFAVDYLAQRSVNASGPYQAIHEKPVRLDIARDLTGDEIVPPRPGFVDYQRWDDEGLPASHVVNGVPVEGPENDTKYYYQVSARDIFGRQGAWSVPRDAMPVAQTPPMAPSELHVNPSKSPRGLALGWRKVTRDVANHQILDATQTYRIFRAETMAELEDMNALAGHLVATVTADPGDPGTPTLDWVDTDPSLAPAYGERDYWYRIACVDLHNNQSAPSAIASGRIPDTTPPGPTKVEKAMGFADHIRIFWRPNPEPDLAGYQIYRGVCDRGKIYHPPKPGHDQPQPDLGCDMVLIGTLPLAEVQSHTDGGDIFFDDSTVPLDSPLCYAYWVRAYDVAQNLYPGTQGCPASKNEYVCQRLYEQTPPPAPIITGLKARDGAVLVEWIAAPVQDLRAFHIYRSDAENSPPHFLGCMLTGGIPWPDKWTTIAPSCEDIPAELNPAAARGSFLDDTVEPHRIYWYRVSALDWLANESEAGDLTRLPAISTFTYTRALPPSPRLRPQTTEPVESCGLVVRWKPEFDPEALDGFVVFRSAAASGGFRQVSAVIAGNEFRDASARRGVDYWYCVQALGRRGELSPPSSPLPHRY